MNLDRIKQDLTEFVKERDLEIFEVNYLKNDKTLQIILDNKLDMEKIEVISNEISNYLDKYSEEFEDNYLLDVSTVGAERPIRNKQELLDALNQYIYVQTKNEEYYGTLIEYKDDDVSLQIKDKTRIKNVTVKYSEIKNVRYAVKF